MKTPTTCIPPKAAKILANPPHEIETLNTQSVARVGRIPAMKSAEEYHELAAKIQSMMSKDGATVGSVYLALADCGEDISPQDFVSSLLVAWGTSLPETAILINDYPAIEYIRHMPLEDQEIFLRNEGVFPLAVLSKSGCTTQMRTYKQLNDLDCVQLFDAGTENDLKTCVHNMRTLEKALANPDGNYFVRVKI